MKSSQLFTICFLQLLIRIDSQTQIVRCGRLGLKNLVPFLTQSFRASHHWPWHAAVYHQYNNSDPIYQCGGTLISSKSVLTAGHCVTVNNAQLHVEQVSVSLGRLILDTDENDVQSRVVSKIFTHPNYNTIDYANDIAIIILSADAIFNNYVQPICLWKADRTDLSEVLGKLGTVVGWGRTENGTKSNVLQQAHFPVIDLLTCLKSNPAFFGDIISGTNFCAGTRNGTSACQGDSGGSIAFEENGSYYIRGIVSVGQGKKNLITQEIECDAMQYAIFTDVAKYLPWIKTTLKCETEVSCETELSSRLQIAVNRKAHFPSCGRLYSKPLPLITRSYDAHHWPWHAAIYHRKGDSDPTYFCGGTVISSKLILTAAFCVQIDAKNISVSLGRLNLSANETSDQTFGVADVISHPEFFLKLSDNNIAIIKLATDAKFNQYVQPICLWNSSKTDLSEVVGKIGTIVGWGHTETGQEADVLQEASFPVVSQIECLRSRRGLFGLFLNKNNFCAGHRNGTSACTGDYGGSMTFEENGVYYIRGILTISTIQLNPATQEFECDGMQYVILTDVAKYLPWIKSTMEYETKLSSEPAPSLGETESSSCGQLSPTLLPLVTHNYDTHHWPWHAAIYSRIGESKPSYLCGGTLVSSKAILTAATCVKSDDLHIDAKNISVSLGRLKLNLSEYSLQSFEVAEVIVHPEFNTEDYDNNIAIVKLKTDAKFNHHVQPICLWKSHNSDISEILGEFGTAVGWRLTEKGKLSNVLQKATLPVVDQLDCLLSNRELFKKFLAENNFCVGHPNGSGVCNGDGGGSMTFEENGVYYIRGIASDVINSVNQTTGQIECDSMQYALFTDVAKYLSWIKDNL